MNNRYNSICICGGGSLGMVCATVAATNGFGISILTGHPSSWGKTITSSDSHGREYTCSPKVVTTSAQEALASADIVLLCVPGFLIEKTLADIRPFIGKEVPVGSIVSSTGFFFDAHRLFADSEQPLFGFQRVPFIARTDLYGHTARLLGYKPSLNLAVENLDNPQDLAAALESAFATPVKLLENFYEASLTNSNPILHTGRLYSLWGPDADDASRHRPTMFYADWDDMASSMIIAMDREFMALTERLGLRPGAIQPLLEYYESHDEASLTRKIRSIEAFKDIKAPMRIGADGSLAPDFSSRYFTEDFPYGLKIISDLAHDHDVDTPVINKVLEWGLSVI